MKNNETIQTPKTIWNPMFLSIFFASIALNLGQQMSNSNLSLYAKSLMAPADQIGQLMSMFAVTALIFRFISGPAMNAFNRKYLVAMAMGLMTIAYLGFSFSPLIAAATGINVITVMKGFRLVQGIGNAFGNSCCMTMASDALPKEKLSSGLGYFALAGSIAQAIGPSIGIGLRNAVGYNLTYVITACVMTIAIVLVSLIVKTAPRETVPFNLKPGNMIAKEAFVPAAIVLMVAMGFTSINSFLLVFAEERGISGASFFFTIYAIVLLATRPMIGKLTDRYGFVKIAIPSIFMTILSLVMIGFATNLPILLAAAFINAFGYGAVQPMLQSLCMKSVEPKRKGSASGTYYIAMDTATILGPSVCGKVASIMGYTSIMWIAMCVPIFFGVLVVFLNRKRINRIEEEFINRK